MKKVLWLSFLSVLFCAVSVNATLREDVFNVAVDSQGQVISGGGSGGAHWYYYPNTNWWNIWFYDDPLKLDPWYKIIDLSMTISSLDPAAQSRFRYTINWSTPAWSPNSNAPPLPPLSVDEENLWIGRDGSPGFSVTYTFTDKSFDLKLDRYKLPIPYNPEWISIDIRGYNFKITDGFIRHECIPEPATLMFLGLGSLIFFRKNAP